MKKLVCDVCGGKIIIRAGGAPKCDSCGMEYSENVKKAAEKERLLSNAETCVKLGDFEQAAKVCRIITDEYPYDFRGWWATVIIDTKNLTDFYFLFPESDIFAAPDVESYQAYRNFLSLVPSERAVERTTEFEARLNAFIFERRNTTLTHGISEKQTALESLTTQLLQKKAELDALRSQRKKRLTTSVIGTSVLFVLSVLIFSVPGWSGFWFFFVLPVLTYFVYRLLSIIKDDEYKNRVFHMVKNISLDCERIEKMKSEMHHKQTILQQEDYRS
jgi:hypothetical protein